MNEQLIFDFITQYIPLRDADKAVISQQNLFRVITKNTVLLQPDQFAKECYFILKGCIRKYYLVDGEERNTAFYFENDTITPSGYFTKKPSAYFLATLEETIVAIGSEERNKVLIERIPALAAMIQTLNTENITATENELDTFKTLSPENRYLHLLTSRPDIFDRIPLYHIATYLGITPVSLSRMRKRLLTS